MSEANVNVGFKQSGPGGNNKIFTTVNWETSEFDAVRVQDVLNGFGVNNGSIVQSVNLRVMATFSTTSDTLSETPIELTITPKMLGNEILVMVNFPLYIDNPSNVNSDLRRAIVSIERTTGTPVEIYRSIVGRQLVAASTVNTLDGYIIHIEQKDPVTVQDLNSHRYVVKIACSNNDGFRCTIPTSAGNSSYIKLEERKVVS